MGIVDLILDLEWSVCNGRKVVPIPLRTTILVEGPGVGGNEYPVPLPRFLVRSVASVRGSDRSKSLCLFLCSEGFEGDYVCFTLLSSRQNKAL